MRLNAAGNLDFEVRARIDNVNDRGGALLQLRIGPLHFTITESEGLRLANRIADAIEHHRISRERTEQQ